MSLFKDKVLLITGGRGSFGNAVLNRFLKTDIGEIRISSLGVVIGAHCGPGLLAVFYLCNGRTPE